jgi:excisionase family DNA binding protein
MTAVDLDDIRGKAVITVTEAAELLSLDPRSVRRGIQEGNLPGIKVGRRILIPVPKLLAMLETDN